MALLSQAGQGVSPAFPSTGCLGTGACSSWACEAGVLELAAHPVPLAATQRGLTPATVWTRGADTRWGVESRPASLASAQVWMLPSQAQCDFVSVRGRQGMSLLVSLKWELTLACRCPLGPQLSLYLRPHPTPLAAGPSSPTPSTSSHGVCGVGTRTSLI